MSGDNKRETEMKLVNQLLDSKGHDILWITPSASVLDAIKLMAEKGVGALIVMDGEAMAGIVTERDYARKVILKGRSSDETPVSDIMSTGVLSTSPDQTVSSCMNVMTDKRRILILSGIFGVLYILVAMVMSVMKVIHDLEVVCIVII